GSASADTLTGDGNANVIDGGAGNDNIDGGDGDDVINGGAGNDTILGGDGTSDGNDTLNGGADVDTLDYSGSSSAITSGTIDLAGGSLTNAEGDVDTISGFENYLLTTGDDSIQIDTDAFSELTSIDGGSGTDNVTLNGVSNLTDANIEGSDFASLFSDVEELDFTNTDLTGGDLFDIGDSDISSITNGSGSLTIFVNSSTIALSDINVLDQTGSVTSDDIVGNVRTVVWDSGNTLSIQS
ncbi:MAG: hypothetical protein ACRBB3_01460, partial [Alphaproteobacteria bacterium]